jgi:hypothetical protein
MDIIEKAAQELRKHSLITSAGLCVSPGGMQDPESDIDIFVYCSAIPGAGERESLFSGLSGEYTPGAEDTRWGICDLALIGGTEVWLMYVTEQRTKQEAEAILSGTLPEKLDNYYYPVGRLATLKNIEILFERDGFLSGMKESVREYPKRLAHILASYHAEALEDVEDIERAAKRGDVLFYHFALDIALDHFLQVLFALNHEYFPSRKRSLRYIGGFKLKPEGCAEDLQKIVETGAFSGTLNKSFELMKKLIDWTCAPDVFI